MAMKLTLLSLLSGALGWKYTSIAVPGSQVKEAGNLTMGGKIGTYTVLLQVLNPGAGNLEALLACCDDAQPLAGEISMRINTNQFEGIGHKPIMQHIKDKFVGEGKCSISGPIQSMLQQGQEQCQYLYAFKNKDWKQYQYMSYCVPEDVCAIDVVGATKGTKVGYNVVIQILNPNAGDLIYAGEGPVSDCLAGSNMVNLANTTTFKTEATKYIDVFGHKLPAGTETKFQVPGMKEQGLLNMIGQCKETAEKGMLYVYKNKIWSNSYSSMNVSRFLDKQAAAQADKEVQDVLATKAATPASPEAAPAAPATPAPAAPAAPAPSLKVPDVGALVAALKPKLQQEEKAGVDPEEDTKATQALVNKAEDKVEDEATDAAPAVPPAPEAPKVELPKIELPKVDLGAELKKKGDEAAAALKESTDKMATQTQAAVDKAAADAKAAAEKTAADAKEAAEALAAKAKEAADKTAADAKGAAEALAAKTKEAADKTAADAKEAAAKAVDDTVQKAKDAVTDAVTVKADDTDATKAAKQVAAAAAESLKTTVESRRLKEILI